MSGDLGSLISSFQCILGASPWLADIDVLELPWQQEKLDAVRRRAYKPGQAVGRLVLGLMETDDSVRPYAAIRRGLAITRRALLSCGYEVRKNNSRRFSFTHNLAHLAMLTGR